MLVKNVGVSIQLKPSNTAAVQMKRRKEKKKKKKRPAQGMGMFLESLSLISLMNECSCSRFPLLLPSYRFRYRKQRPR